jgi:hypothetical protein
MCFTNCLLQFRSVFNVYNCHHTHVREYGYRPVTTMRVKGHKNSWQYIILNSYVILVNFRLSFEHASNALNSFCIVILLLNVCTCYNLPESIIDMHTRKGITKFVDARFKSREDTGDGQRIETRMSRMNKECCVCKRQVVIFINTHVHLV